MDTPFNIISVCREDVATVIKDKKTAEALTDDEMRRIANKMSDAYLNNGYWQDLKEITEMVLKGRV
jgi:hypothetical protein